MLWLTHGFAQVDKKCYSQTHVPPEHSSPLWHLATVAEHLQTLLAASQ